MRIETLETDNTSKVVSEAEWLVARKDLLTREKELTRLRDEVSRHRRELPWVRVKKEYIFDGPNGQETLTDLFDSRSQLIVYHFMFGPDWEEGCKSCSYLADHFDGANWHLPHRDVSFAVISRAPLPKLEAYKRRMGWRFKWLSSYGNDFNFDYQVSFTKEDKKKNEAYYNYGKGEFIKDELPGLSVFHKGGNGVIFTPIPPTRADWTTWWALTIFSTWSQRAAREPLRLFDGMGPTPRPILSGLTKEGACHESHHSL